MIVDTKEFIINRDKINNLQEFTDLARSELGEYAKIFTSSTDFLKNRSSDSVKIKLVKFDGDCLTSEILDEIERAGYKLPEAQDAIWLASQYPELQIQFPVAFLHEPWINPLTKGGNVLILRSYSGLRYLHMHLFDSRWYSHIRFAVIK